MTLVMVAVAAMVIMAGTALQMRLVLVWWALLRLIGLMPLRLDAAQGPAQLINLPFIGQFLAFSQFDQFKDFVQLVQRVPEGFRNLGGVGHGLADGRGFGWAKVGGFDPRLGLGTAMLRRGRTFRQALAGPRRHHCGGRFRSIREGFDCRLGNRLEMGARDFLGRSGIAGLFGMRFAKVT
jgi:hypothetical protein